MSDSQTTVGSDLLHQLDEWRRQGLLESVIDHWHEEQKTTPSLSSRLATVAQLLIRRGIELFHAGHIEEALAYFQLATRAQPDNAAAFNNMGNCLRDLACMEESSASYLKALELQPSFADAHSGLLMNMHYQSSVTMDVLAKAHKEWADRHGRFPLLPARTLSAQENERPLRIGFVSADFGQHPVGYFLVRYLENIDRQNFIISTYADGRRQGYLAERLRAAVTHYHDTQGLSDVALAAKIHADNIDILIDLSGHTAGNRLGVFARKPAPVQIGWLGYPWENGLPTMDFLIGDPHILPQQLQPHLQSRILHLPDCFVCFDLPPETLPVNTTPALSDAPFTFGFIGNPGKCGSDVLKLWAEILLRLPQSRLLLKYQGFGEVMCRKRFEDSFAALGVARERLVFESRSDLLELFSVMQTIDLALDPFPFSGGLMSSMLLAMGIPIMTLPGNTFASRQGLSFLTTIGMTDTIAMNRQDYIDKTLALAKDLPRLNTIRQKMRPMMLASSFCEGKNAAKSLETILRQAWRDRLQVSS